MVSVAEGDNFDKTSIRVDDDATRVVKPLKTRPEAKAEVLPQTLTGQEAETVSAQEPATKVEPDAAARGTEARASAEAAVNDQNPSATQFTVYSAPHNHSAGFAQARQLAQESLQSGTGSLLKKRFLLESVLGEGGMGTVYKTKDLRKVEAEDPNPYIATKVLNSAFKDHPDAFVTLQQETAKSQTLAHPNIVTVHDFDRDGDTLFMTMELLEGEPLDKLLRHQAGKGLPKQQVWTIARDLGAALSYAHQRQIIHADFKPGNIFVGSDGHAKVLDFGIARAASKESQKHKFDAGQLGALTPAYASIEMVRDEPVSFSDDVYALAVVIYEMLSGRHPFKNRSALEAKEQRMRPARIEQLSAREWKALSHALALDKAARTATVQEFLRELFPRRNSALARVAVTVALVSLVGAGWFGYRQHVNRINTQQAVATKLAAAQGCFARSDFTCAIEQSLVAVNLDPQNQAAAQLLQAAQLAKQERADDEKVVQLLREANDCLARGEAACVQVKARDVLAMKADNAQAKLLLAEATRQLEDNNIRDLVQQGESCLQQGDTNCAQLFLDKARAINSEHSATQTLATDLSSYQQRQASAQQAQSEQIQQLLSRANQCWIRKDYTCAIAQSEAVLRIDGANAQAIEIKQAAALGQQQARDLGQKVDKLLDEADACLARKDYSCSIAKAESALDLAPGNARAQALKNRAQETQRKLKESGFNIK